LNALATQATAAGPFSILSKALFLFPSDAHFHLGSLADDIKLYLVHDLCFGVVKALAYFKC
jgi:hypothetical protein